MKNVEFAIFSFFILHSTFFILHFTFIKMHHIISHIINFLLPENEHLAGEIGYTDDEKEFEKFRVIIRPSGFFDKENYGKISFLPKLPLQTIDGTEILFGTPDIEQKNGKIFVNADIIASSFFLLSRYEEWLCSDVFDKHSRFEGKKSLQYRANFLHRPLVDEYAVLLRKWLKITGLEVNEPKEEIKKIYLTHDIDFLEYYRHLRGFVGGIWRGLNFTQRRKENAKSAKFILSLHPLCENLCAICVKQFKSLQNIKNDPAYTFDFLIEQDNKVKNAEKIYFVKAAKRAKDLDYPQYNLNGNDFQNLAKFLQKNDCKIGLHSSYNAFYNPQDIENEQNRISKAISKDVTNHRTHYLRILPPNQPEFYTKAGITDDFTLCFADVAGFRLGTCRPVRWINPQTLEIEDITLHPLTIMECSLSNENYMNLNFETAFEVCKNLINQVEKHNGELVLLWHNTSVIPENGYHRELYEKVIEELGVRNG